MRARDHWHEMIRQVEREYFAAWIASELLDERLRADPAFLKSRRGTFSGTPDAKRMKDQLEATYLLRLFAVFEAALREAWKKAYGKSTEPRMRDLIEGIARQARRIPADWLREVHRVREHRNHLIHGGQADFLTLQEARRALSRFLSRLPEDW